MSAAVDTPPALDLFVPGIPAPGGSKKAFRHASTGRIVVMDAARRNKPWRERVAAFAATAFPRPPLAGPLEVWVEFVVPRPAGHSGKRGLRPSAPPYPVTRPDATKLWRAAEDALSGVVWRDDSQIVSQHVRKVYGDRPGVRVVVTEVNPP